MHKVFANGAAGALGAALLLGSAATAESSDSRFAAALPDTYGFDTIATEGNSFAGHAQTTLREPIATRPLANSTYLPAFDTGPRSFDDLEAPAYRLPGSNPTSRKVFDAADQSTVDSPAAGEPNTLIMLLGAVGVVLYQLHRKQRSLEQRPLSL